MAVIGTRRHDSIDRCARGEKYGYFQERSPYIDTSVPRYMWDKVNANAPKSNSIKSRQRKEPAAGYKPKYKHKNDIWGRVPGIVKNFGLYYLKAKGLL